MSRDATDMDALVSLISSSVDIIKNVCRDAGSLYPALGGPNPSVFEKMDRDKKLEVRRAARIIEAASAQLCATVMRPEDTLLNKALSYTISACLNFVTSRNIPGLLLDEPSGLHVSAIAEASGIDEGYVARILRLLVTNHIFQEVAPNVFANNVVSVKLATSSSTKAAVELTTREAFRAGAYITDYLTALNKSDPEPVSPFQLAYGPPLLMDYHNTPEGKESIPVFAAGVAGYGEIIGREELIYAFPWTKHFAQQGVKICDVGAGNGHVLLMLAKAYPSYPFHAVVQDRPELVEIGKQLWSSELPEAVQDGRVEFVPIDFFKDSPVEGCDIYYIRHCIHNWTDDKAVIVLNNIAKAMRSKPGSILLIHEIVMRHALGATATDVNVPGSQDIPPRPLLRNFGAARFRDYAQDIQMLSILNAKQRTLEEFIDLGSKAGLVFERLWDSGETGLVQFRLE